jgi:hypothetical protein
MITKVTFIMQTIVDNPLFNTLLPLDKMSVINSGLWFIYSSHLQKWKLFYLKKTKNKNALICHKIEFIV